MTTVLQITDRALEHIGIKGAGETTSAEDADVCVRALSAVLDAFQLEGAAVVGMRELVFTPTAGAQSVSIGPTVGLTEYDIEADVPPFISQASYYRASGVDQKLGWLNSFEEYAEQASKSSQGQPAGCYYMRSPTSGTVYLWPASDGTFELHLWVSQEVVTGQSTLALANNLTLPNGYRLWLEYALAAELCPTYMRSSDLTQLMTRRAQRALTKVKRGNFVSHQIATNPALPY